MPRWIIQYIFEDENGNASVSMSKISAPNKDVARNMAAKRSPYKNFMVTVQLESDDQFLDTVGQKAKIMTGKSTAEVPDAEEED